MSLQGEREQLKDGVIAGTTLVAQLLDPARASTCAAELYASEGITSWSYADFVQGKTKKTLTGVTTFVVFTIDLKKDVDKSAPVVIRTRLPRPDGTEQPSPQDWWVWGKKGETVEVTTLTLIPQ